LGLGPEQSPCYSRVGEEGKEIVTLTHGPRVAVRGRERELRCWARRWVAAFARLLLTWAEAERGGEGAGPRRRGRAGLQSSQG